MKKWFIIRHIRYYYLCIKFHMWWKSIGRYLGVFPNASDLEYLEDVWNGKE